MLDIAQLVQVHFDLLAVGVAVAGILLLGFLIYFTNPKSITSKTFFYLSILTAAWGISNYLDYRFATTTATLWALRIHLFLSTLHAFLFFQLAYVFPKEKAVFSRWYTFILVPIVVMTLILVLTPLVFSGITQLAPPGYVTNPERGPGIVLFSIVAFGLLIAGVVVIAKKAFGSTSLQERKQNMFVATGMALMAVLILLFNVFLPIYFDQLGFIPLAALFTLPFIALISYAIYRFRLFNFKITVVTAGVLGFMVTVFTFINVLYATEPSSIAINIAAFFVVLLGSIKIVRDTLSLDTLATELSETNKRQEGLIHFIGHEVKGSLTKAEGAFSVLAEGDMGVLPAEALAFTERALKETRDGVTGVSDILRASNLKKGTTAFKSERFDLAAVVDGLADAASRAAKAKGLSFRVEKKGEEFYIVGDETEIREHVVRNLIDNAINYTPTGSVTVTLSHEADEVKLSVADTGIGITPEDKKLLFTEGGHGADSLRINVHSTGYGLFIAKNIVTAMGGTITAESAGSGKGSAFSIVFPAKA